MVYRNVIFRHSPDESNQEDNDVDDGSEEAIISPPFDDCTVVHNCGPKT